MGLRNNELPVRKRGKVPPDPQAAANDALLNTFGDDFPGSPCNCSAGTRQWKTRRHGVGPSRLEGRALPRAEVSRGTAHRSRPAPRPGGSDYAQQAAARSPGLDAGADDLRPRHDGRDHEHPRRRRELRHRSERTAKRIAEPPSSVVPSTAAATPPGHPPTPVPGRGQQDPVPFASPKKILDDAVPVPSPEPMEGVEADRDEDRGGEDGCWNLLDPRRWRPAWWGCWPWAYAGGPGCDSPASSG